MESNAILEFHHISKRFFGVSALEDIELAVPRGGLLGLIGENGAGKSTLMNIIGGVITPDEGSMTMLGNPYAPRSPRDAIAQGIAFIHQELNLFDNLSIAENIYIDNLPRVARAILDRRSMLKRVRAILESIELDESPTTRVETLSPGEKQMVEIGKAISSDAKLIIFDEPTTSLTARETERLFRLIRRLKDEGKSVVYISHILKDVANLADEIAVLRDGKLVARGNASQFDTGRMISLMVGRDIENIYPPRSKPPTAEEVLRVDRVSEPRIMRDIELAVGKGEIVGLFGLMGSGRTELARAIFGVDGYERGGVFVDNEPLPKADPIACIKRGVAFVTEDRRNEGLMMQQSIAENLGLVSIREFMSRIGSFVRQSSLRRAVQGVSESLRIKTTDIEARLAKTLSGGNQQKAVIGKWLVRKPLVLIMDEPTKGIDVGAKYEVYSIMDQLAADGTAILFISSELEELMGMCDRIIVLNKGEIVGTFARSEFDEELILRSAFRHQEVDAADMGGGSL